MSYRGLNIMLWNTVYLHVSWDTMRVRISTIIYAYAYRTVYLNTKTKSPKFTRECVIQYLVLDTKIFEDCTTN